MEQVAGSGARRHGVASGIGAGAGAALAMVLVMVALRFGLGVPTIPELMLGPILLLMGGQAFSQALDTLYYAGRPLLFAVILEGILLVGVLLGLLYAWLARPRDGERPVLFGSVLGGIVYGLVVGLLLDAIFLPLLGERPFAERATGVYSNSPVPLWLGLVVLSLVYGVTVHLLLPRTSFAAAPAAPLPASDSPALQRAQDRRQFLRIAGGTVLAILGGALVWGGGTVLNQGGLISPVDVQRPDDVLDADVVADDPATPTAQSVTPAQPPAGTATAVPPTATQLPPSTYTPQPTDVPTSAPTTPPTVEAAPATSTLEPPATSTLEPPATATLEPPTEVPPTDTPLPPTSTPLPPPTATTVPAQAVKIPLREITPIASFYHVSKNFFDPSPSALGWTLTVKGKVSNPYSLSYNDLLGMPSKAVTVGMMCISNPVGGNLIGNQTWKGVPLADILKRAKPTLNVVDVMFTAEDGYTDSISLKKALDPNVMLVWEMGGYALPPEHGGPARLLVPGIYGMKHVKWLNTIELVNYDYKGYWQQPSQGWSDPAPVNTMSRIDLPAPGPVPLTKQLITGIAFAADRSISKVEVSTDGGNTWQPAYVKPPLSGTSWVLWGYEWTPPAPGKYVLQVRATDGKGNLQSSRRTDPYPNGATGYHTVTVRAAK